MMVIGWLTRIELLLLLIAAMPAIILLILIVAGKNSRTETPKTSHWASRPRALSGKKGITLSGVRSPIRTDVGRGAGVVDRQDTTPIFFPSEAAPLESNVELFRGRIQPGHDRRRVDAYSLGPHKLIESQTEQRPGGSTGGEGVSKWLHDRVPEGEAPTPGGWFRRLLRLGQ